MGGPGRGSGLEAKQAGVGPGVKSPSEPTVLKDVELPEPRREAMVGVAEAAGGVEHTFSPRLSQGSLLLSKVLPSSIPVLSHQGPLWASGLHFFHPPPCINLGMSLSICCLTQSLP